MFKMRHLSQAKLKHYRLIHWKYFNIDNLSTKICTFKFNDSTDTIMIVRLSKLHAFFLKRFYSTMKICQFQRFQKNSFMSKRNKQRCKNLDQSLDYLYLFFYRNIKQMPDFLIPVLFLHKYVECTEQSSVNVICFQYFLCYEFILHVWYV